MSQILESGELKETVHHTTQGFHTISFKASRNLGSNRRFRVGLHETFVVSGALHESRPCSTRLRSRSNSRGQASLFAKLRSTVKAITRSIKPKGIITRGIIGARNYLRRGANTHIGKTAN